MHAHHLSSETLSAFAWVKSYADVKKISRKELAASLGYDESTISKIYNLNYVGNTSHIVAAIERYRASLLSKIDSPSQFPFVQTAVADTIHGYMNLAVKWRKIGIIIGESQTGKDRNTRAYKPEDEKRVVIHMRIPQGGTKSKTVLRLCETLDVSDKFNTAQREKYILRKVTRDHVFIFHELQQCASRPRAGGRMTTERVDTIEYLRDMKDESGCTMIFEGTTEALDMLEGKDIAEGKSTGHDSGHILIQTLKRSLDPLILKNNPPKRDLDKFAMAVGLPPAEGKAKELQDHQVITRGLEVWLTYLLAAVEIAASRSRAVTWDDVIAARKTFSPGAEL